MEVSSTIFKVFGMTRLGIEPRSPGPLANILSTWPMMHFLHSWKSHWKILVIISVPLSKEAKPLFSFNKNSFGIKYPTKVYFLLKN